jgi:hypothetical protein
MNIRADLLTPQLNESYDLAARVLKQHIIMSDRFNESFELNVLNAHAADLSKAECAPKDPNLFN